MGKFTSEGFEYDDGKLVQWPDDNEIRVVDLDGNTVAVYREDDMEYHEWVAKFQAMRGLTVEQLIEQLKQCKNQKAVACLCVDGMSYSAISAVVDRTTAGEQGDDIGNALLTLDPESEVATTLKQLEV